MAQVRLDPDVAAALQRAAERTGRSVSAEANSELRRALGLHKPSDHPALQAAASVSAPPRRPIGAGPTASHPLHYSGRPRPR